MMWEDGSGEETTGRNDTISCRPRGDANPSDATVPSEDSYRQIIV